MIKKIVVIGPESTGKSTLCERLAQHYNTIWCPEYAREYLSAHGNGYSYDDLLTIAKGQIAIEDEFAARVAAVPGQELLFIDTDMYVMKVWCEFVFGKCHPFILEQLALRRYDLYFLCRTDLPWSYDPLREYPDAATREKLYGIYYAAMTSQQTAWTEIFGDSEQRMAIATRAVDDMLTHESHQ